MIKTTDAYKEAIKKNRILHHKINIAFPDGSTATAEDAELRSFQIKDNTSNQSSFDIGGAFAKQLTIKLDNMDGKFTDKNFDNAKITAKVGLEISGKTEWLDKGAFYSETGIDTGNVIAINAYDKMINFDRPYSLSKLQYPATLLSIVQDACTCCNVTLAPDSASFPNNGYVVDERPEDSSINFRKVLQWVGQISCTFMRINDAEQLSLRWYDTDLLESDGIEASKNVVKITDLGNGSSLSTNDVIITGIKVEEKGEGTDTTYQYGADGYVLEISDNDLIQNGNGASVSEFIGKKLNGLQFRPLTLKCQSDPSIEPGDIGLVTDSKGKKHRTIFTAITYTAYAQQELICGAETPTRLSIKRWSETTKVYKSLRKNLLAQKTEFEKALGDLAKQMQDSKGLFPITLEQEDGSSILYFCDTPKLEDAKVVIKLSSAGWAMSTDGGETWNVGALVDGEMIAKLLAVQGVNADWINTGALRVLDADGKETLYINADTGEVRATPTLFSLSGKSVGDIANAAVEDFVNKVYRKDLEKLQNQIDGKVEEYYYAYEPTLDNLPASEWKTEEDKKAHEGDKFFDKSTGHAYRFFRNDKTGEYEWTLIQDADAIEALNKAAHAQETADGKRRVFITTPQPPYDPGDLWVQGSTGDIMVCKTGKEEGVYKSDDWVKSNKYTDDKKAEEALEAIEKLKTLNVVLNNEHQTVSTDADGNYKNFPEVATTVSVYMGSVDVTGKATYTVAKSAGITGSWNLSTKTYTVTGLSADSGYVDITTSYSGLKGTRRFTIAKLKAGAAGPAGTGVEVDVTSIEYQIGSSGTVKPTGSWSTDIPDVPAGKYLWTRTSVTYSDGATTETYTVSYKSTDGKNGKDGVSPTVSISKSGNTTTITIKDEKGTHTQTVKDGTDGTPGTPGVNGKTPYFHVKYSNDGGKTFTSNSGETVGSYIGTCTDYNSADPTTVGAYTWAKIRGKDGDSVSIESQQTTYQASNSGVTIPTGTWNTSIPSLNSGQYLWTRTVVNYSDGTTTTSYSVSYKGTNGKDGENGEDGGTWTIEVSSNTIKRGEDGVLKPSSITAKAWYQVGKTVSRTAYAGRLYVYTSTNGSTWTQVSKSDTSSSITYDASKLAKTIYWLKFALCAAGTDTVIDQQTVQILDDVSSLTGAIMLNKLSGGWQGIYQGDDGKYYIDAEYIRGKTMSAEHLDARNLTVTNNKGVVTLKIDSDGNVDAKLTSLSIAGSSAATQEYVNNTTAAQLEKAKIYANSKTGNLLNGPDLTENDRKEYWNIVGSITEGQTDPDGGKNAILITGTESDSYISAKYENNNPVRTKGQYEVRIWMKSSAALKTCISFNRTAYEVSVTTTWKLYKFSIPITVPSKAGQENFTIGGFSKLVKGNKLYIYKPEVTYSYTPEDILNMLTNNGAADGIFFNGNQLYVKGERISVDDLYAIGATIGGWKINKNNLSSATGNISLTKDGKIKIGSAVLYSAGHAAVIKSGLTIYTDRSNEFSDGTGEFRIYGATSGSGYLLTLSGKDNVVYLQASSSRRYKDHIKDVLPEEAEKLLSLPVVWFRYKDGYLQKNDALYGKSIPGFYAEDVSRLFPECAVYDEEGRPEDWNYRMLIPAMLKLIQNLYKEVRGK